jgi:hypothetical protein
MANLAQTVDSVVIGAVAETDLIVGRPVRYGGVHATSGLPLVEAAAASDTRVGVVLAAPDPFPRPFDGRQLIAGPYAALSPYTSTPAWSDPAQTTTMYSSGLSVIENATIPAGARCQWVQRGIVTIGSSAFDGDASTYQIDDALYVNASGVFTRTAGTNVVARVVSVDTAHQRLTIRLTAE